MPEGHVVHRQARRISRAFKGEALEVSSPQGRFAEGAALLDESTIRGADALGKHLQAEAAAADGGSDAAPASPAPEPAATARRLPNSHADLLDKLPIGVLVLGAIAAAMTDTWSTEIGRTYGTNPVDWFTRKPVLAGTSGGITMAGIYGSFAGAISLAILAWMSITKWQVASPVSFAVIFGGLLGATADTMLGSTLQELRRCAVCSTTTEKKFHCGKRTRMYRGIKGFNNDVVNFACSLTGAVTAGLIIKFVLG